MEQFAAFDVQSHRIGGRERFWFGTATYVQCRGGGVVRGRSTSFDHASGFWSWLAEHYWPGKPCWVVSYSVAKELRLLDLFGEVDTGRLRLVRSRGTDPDGEETLPRVILGDPPTIVSAYAVDGCKLELVDLLNWYRCPLETIAGSVGMELLKVPDPATSMPQGTVPDSAEPEGFDCEFTDWRRECCRFSHHRTKIIAAAFAAMLSLAHRAGPVRLPHTGPALAMRLFRARHCRHRIEPSNDPVAISTERSALFGGRCEAFRKGFVPGTVHRLDVRGFYPWVMREFRFPCEMLIGSGESRVPFPLHSHQWIDSIATVDVSADRLQLPHRIKGRVSYDPGSYTTTLCGPELVQALRAGAVRRVHRWQRYRMEPVFGDWVDAVDAGRSEAEQAGDSAAGLIWKLLANGLFGKFAQQDERWEQIEKLHQWPRWGLVQRVHAETGQTQRVRLLDGRAYVCTGKVSAAGTFPAIAAFVTSYGRMVMDELRKLAGDSNVYYQGTDGLFTNDAGLERLCRADRVGGGDLGSIRVEASASSAYFDGAGTWRHAGRICRQGFKGIVQAGNLGSHVASHAQSAERWLHDPLDDSIPVRTVAKQVGLGMT